MVEDGDHISALRDAFLEEAEDHMQALESGLSSMAHGENDAELVNRVFRAAHSIKGGAGAFGFPELVGLTHWMETLLDTLRSSGRPASAEEMEVLLDSQDALAELIASAIEGSSPEMERADQIEQRLRAITRRSMLPLPGHLPTAFLPPRGAGFSIRFKPLPTLLKSGNDVIPLLKEPGGLGALAVEVDQGAVPEDFGEMQPDVCYFAWSMKLEGDVSEAQVREVFEWVCDDCELTIEPLVQSVPMPKAASIKPEPARPLTAKPAGAAQSPAAKGSGAGGSNAGEQSASNQRASVRVPIRKLDELVDTVGELVITQSVLEEIARKSPAQNEALQAALLTLARQVQDLRWRSLGMRMLPLDTVFRRMPRLVRDTGRALGKDVDFEMHGQELEVDKTVLEKLNDPLVRLLRNAVDHGLEATDVRIAAGKPPRGLIGLRASRQAGKILVEVTDDGAGINTKRVLAKGKDKGLVPASQEDLTPYQLQELIFSAGFSTAAKVTDVSGRGVGLDVVRENIRLLGGDISLHTSSKGSSFAITLPLSLSIIDAQLVRICSATYVFPLSATHAHMAFEPARLRCFPGGVYAYQLKSDVIPVVDGAAILATEQRTEPPKVVVVVEGYRQRFGLLADDLVGQQAVVVRSLGANYRDEPGIAGATVLGDGSVVLIVDPLTLSRVITPVTTEPAARSVGAQA